MAEETPQTVPSVEGAPAQEPTGQVPADVVSRVDHETAIRTAVSQATSTTQRELAQLRREFQTLQQRAQSGYQPTEAEMAFMQGRQVERADVSQRQRLAQAAKDFGVDVDLFSPEFESLLSAGPVELVSHLLSKGKEAMNKSLAEERKKLQEETKQAQSEAHNKWSQSGAARVPQAGGQPAGEPDVASMSDAEFEERLGVLKAQALAKRRERVR